MRKDNYTLPLKILNILLHMKRDYSLMKIFRVLSPRANGSFIRQNAEDRMY